MMDAIREGCSMRRSHRYAISRARTMRLAGCRGAAALWLTVAAEYRRLHRRS